MTLPPQIQSPFREHVRVLMGLHGNLLELVHAPEHHSKTQGDQIAVTGGEVSRRLSPSWAGETPTALSNRFEVLPIGRTAVYRLKAS